MTALVAGLTGRSLIVRRADEGRGRHSRIGLSEEGRTLLAEAWPVVTASNSWFGDDLVRATSRDGWAPTLAGHWSAVNRGPA